MARRTLITAALVGVTLIGAMIAPQTPHAAVLTAGAKFDLGGVMPNGYKTAVVHQTHLGGAFARAWGTGPVTFGTGGIPVYFVPMTTEQGVCGMASIGCHGDFGGLFIVVANNLGAQQTEYVVDHEILETLVDPYPASDPTIVNGHLAEVCDPYPWETFDSTGHWILAEWVYPRYFNN